MWASSGGETQAGGGNFLGRISIRRNQVASMEADLEDLEFFQKKISERFSDLLLPKDNDKSTGDLMMSIEWLRRLVDAFLCCEAEFKAVLLMGRDASHFGKSPLDKMISELLDRTVKALDVCNGITHGVEAIRHAQKLAEVAVLALEHRPFTDGQIRRARKSLASLLTSVVVDEKEGKSTERSWSFGRRDGVSTAAKDRHLSNFRSLSWSVSKNWSAAKQIQAISNNLYPPRGERTGLVTHIPVPKQPGWAQTMCGLQEKIAEEWKKKEKKGSAGLMEEIVRAEKLSQSLMDLLANFQFPMESEREAEIAAQVAELAEICRRMEEGLGPLQQQIREVFHRIVRSRTEVLDMLDQAAKASGQNL